MAKDKKDFYIKKVGQRGKISIWIVDGNKIRSSLEREFTNFGQHFRFPVIPEYEFWLDKEAVPNERKFFVDHLLVQWRLMEKGVPYLEALDKADKKEMAERKKAGDIKKIKKEKGDSLMKKIHRGLWGKTNEGISIWLVDGRLVRSVFDVNFTEGGHDLVYSYVPGSEVWLDDDVVEHEREYIVLHELYERSLMKGGLPYKEAHKKASRAEWEARHGDKSRLSHSGWRVL